LARAKDWRYFSKTEWFARETNTAAMGRKLWVLPSIHRPSNQEKHSAKKADEDWMPVDLYVGGAEHAVLHLLYARSLGGIKCYLISGT
jgi:leucyl-tRNA synthetase